MTTTEQAKPPHPGQEYLDAFDRREVERKAAVIEVAERHAQESANKREAERAQRIGGDAPAAAATEGGLRCPACDRPLKSPRAIGPHRRACKGRK